MRAALALASAFGTVALASAALLATSACGDDGNAGAGSNGPGTVGGNGSISSLTGTWQADYAKAGGGAAPVTLVLSPTEFSLRIDNLLLHADAQGQQFAAAARNASQPNGPELDATISRKSAEVGSLGAIPLPLTGGLRIDSGRADTFCQSTFVDGSIQASCGDIDGFSYLMPGSARGGTASGVRVSQSASSFGDLGGTWTFGLSGGGNCTASFVRATVTASCLHADTHTGSFTIAFDGNRASGSTSEGIEFVAVRD